MQQRASECQQRQNDGSSNEDGKLRPAAGLRNDRGAGRTGIHRKCADQTRQDTAGADPDKVAVDIRRFVGIRYERPRRRRCLHHHDDGNDERQRHQLQPSAERNVGNGKLRQRDRDSAENRDTPALKSKEDDRGGGPDKADQRARDTNIDPLRNHDQGQHNKADDERKQVGLRQLLGQRRQTLEHGPARRRQPKDGRQLRDQDVHGDPGKKADGDRNRQQIGDPAETKNAADDQHHADHERQHAGKRGIFG